MHYCRHPSVSSYVSSVLKNAKPLILSGAVDKMILATWKPCELATIESLSSNAIVDTLTIEFKFPTADKHEKLSAAVLVELQESLRSAVVRLCSLSSSLKPLSKGQFVLVIISYFLSR